MPATRPVRLRPGLAHLARRVPGATIVPLALEYPFWDERTPEALCRFGSADGKRRRHRGASGTGGLRRH